MRLLYVDIDTLRADHLGCYGYHRNTSPNIDELARRAVRFENCYNSDAPCLPSRSALWSGRCGFHTGVVNHGGTAADPFIEGPMRGFRDRFYATSWMSALRCLGFKTVTVSPFGERHAAWHWYAGYNEVYNPGKGGMEIADDSPPSRWTGYGAMGAATAGSCTSTTGIPTPPTARPRGSAIPLRATPCPPG
jgi:hypothetical protein